MYIIIYKYVFVRARAPATTAVRRLTRCGGERSFLINAPERETEREKITKTKRDEHKDRERTRKIPVGYERERSSERRKKNMKRFNSPRTENSSAREKRGTEKKKERI